jgi:hypothetical protein
MVDLAEIQAAYYMVAATGVLIAAVFYAMNLQMARRKLKIDNTILYGNIIYDKERVTQWRHVIFEQQFTSFEEWDKKYRPDPEAFSNLYGTKGLLEMVGMCIKEGIVDPDLLYKKGYVEWIKVVYLKLKPWYIGMRALYNNLSYGYYAEYVYNDVMRLYPDVTVSKDRFKLQ